MWGKYLIKTHFYLLCHFFLNFEMCLTFVDFFQCVLYCISSLIWNIHFCYQFCIDIFVFLSLERAPSVRSFRFHQTWICLYCGSKTHDLLLILLLSLHISQVGKLKLKGESQAYLAKLGQDPCLSAPNLMFFSLHSIKCFDDLSVNNGQGHWT